jgi:hypothetical protein
MIIVIAFHITAVRLRLLAFRADAIDARYASAAADADYAFDADCCRCRFSPSFFAGFRRQAG